MDDQWQESKGTGWIPIEGFGTINPRQDNEAGGRQYFTAKLENDEYAAAVGKSITGGPETWYYEFEDPFTLTGTDGSCVEVTISPLLGGVYGIRFRPGVLPPTEMDDQWQVIKGKGWIPIEGFGTINPRQDNEAGGRQYFTAKLENDEYAAAVGKSITGGPETWYYEFEDPFTLTGTDGSCVEVTISPLLGGVYGIRFRPGVLPPTETGGW